MLASCCTKPKPDIGPDTVYLEIFMRILFSQIAVKGHICNAKNSRLGHDLAISVDNSDFAFCEGFIFKKFQENKTLAKISEFTVCKRFDFKIVIFTH